MSFRLIFELEPRGDLKKIRQQIELFGPIVDAILVPDNHLGRAAISSIAIALEVRNHGFKPIVCLNARDRNHIRLESDLLTLTSYEVDEVLLVPGDPVAGAGEPLRIRDMLEHERGQGLVKGVIAPIGKPLRWRATADWLITKLNSDPKVACDWRDSLGIKHPIYSGLIALPDRKIAERVVANIPDLKVPEGFLDGFTDNGDHGLTTAISQLDELYRCGLDGAQLVVPARRQRFAELLERWIEGSGVRS